MRSSISVTCLEQSRLDEIELLDEAELAEAAGGSIATLNVDSEPPLAEVDAQVGTALPARAGDLSALVNRAAAANGAEIICGRKRYHPQIDLRVGYVVLIVMVRTEREVQRMMRMREQPARVVALNSNRVTVADIAAAEQREGCPRIECELRAPLQAG